MSAYLVIAAHIQGRGRFISGCGAAAAELTARFGSEYLVRAPGLRFWRGRIPAAP